MTLFCGCKNLKTITIKSKKLKSKTVGGQAFKNIHKKAVIKVPKKQKKTYAVWLRKKGIEKTVKIKLKSDCELFVKRVVNDLHYHECSFCR